jgi:hypothetical protein
MPFLPNLLLRTKRTIISDTERRFSVFRMIRVGLALAYIQGIVVVAIAIVFAVVHHDGIVGNSAALIDTPEKSEIME